MVSMVISVNNSISMIQSKNLQQLKISDEMRSEVLNKMPETTTNAIYKTDELIRRNARMLQKLTE